MLQESQEGDPRLDQGVLREEVTRGLGLASEQTFQRWLLQQIRLSSYCTSLGKGGHNNLQDIQKHSCPKELACQ